MALLKRNIKRSLSIIISASMIMTSTGIGFSENLKTFSDIENHWAKTQIQKLVKKRVISGYSDGTFKPNKQITRAEFIALINKAYNFKLVYDIDFKDVSADDWFYEDIRKAKAKGYISGYEDNTVRPNDLITRQEVAVIMEKVLKISKTGKSQVLDKFKDKDEISSWAKASVELLVSRGYLNGYPDETFGPKKNITRAEAAAMLGKVFKSNSSSSFTIKKKSDNKSSSSSSSSSSVKTISKGEYSTESDALQGTFDELKIDSSVGDGDVYLKNIKVTGDTYIYGGGENSIHIKDSKLGNVVVNKEDDKVRLVAEGSTTVEKLTLKSGAIIDEEESVENKLTESGFGDIVIEDKDKVTLKGDFDEVQVNTADADIYLDNGEVKKLELKEKAENAKIHIGKDAKIDKVDKDPEASYTTQKETHTTTPVEAGFEFSNGEITGYLGSETEIVIPSIIDGKKVTSIGTNAFKSKGITSVEIPDTVTTIGSGAFSYCKSLTSVTIPKGVTKLGKGAFGYCENLRSATILSGVESIGEYLFYKCTNLESVTIPSGVKSIGNKAFAYCTNLGSAAIPSSVESIGEYSFYKCTNLKSVTIPNGVKSIENKAFGYCTNLASVIIPESVQKINEWAFSGCEKLAEINVDERNTNYSDIDGILFNKDKTVLIQYLDQHGNQYTVPEGVESIEAYSFYKCNNLESVNIPSTVKSIGKNAFKSCAKLKSLTISEGVESIGENAFYECVNLESVIIPSTVNEIGMGAFEYCSKLASVTIPEGVESIGEVSFYECTNLESVTIPSTVNRIGDHAFCACSKLASVTISEGVKEIGFSAFLNCTSLTSVTIPESVQIINEWAFSGCDKLAGINIDKNNANYSDINGVLFNKDKTVLIQYLDQRGNQYTVPEGVTKLAKGAFASTKVTSVTLPESLEIIGFSAFEKCYDLALIEIPQSVTTLDHFAFASCKSLESVTIPNGVKSIGNNAFKSCDNLKSITISSSVESIGDYVFKYCKNLKSVIIPDGVKSIGKYAFQSCESLESIRIPSSVERIGDYPFKYCKNFKSLIIDNYEGAVTIGNYDIADSAITYLKESSSDLDEESIEMSENIRKFYLSLFNKYSKIDKKYTNIVDDMASSYEKLPDDHIFTKGDMKKLKKFSDNDTSLTPELVAPLEYATNLENFEVNAVRSIENFDFLKNCKKLKVLHYLNNDLKYGKDKQIELKNINSLALLTNLEDLRINMTTLKDITPISNLKLKQLILPDNNIEEVNSTIGTITTVERLDMENNKISDISEFNNLVNLRSSYLYNNKITDISPVSKLDKLEALLIHDNNITDITPLKEMNLKRLRIQGNPLPENYMDTVKQFSKINTLRVGNITLGDFEWMKTAAVRPKGEPAHLMENDVRMYSFGEISIEIKASERSIKDGTLTIENPLIGLNNEPVLQDDCADEDKINKNINFKDNKIEVRMDDPAANSIKVKYPIYTEDPNRGFGKYNQKPNIVGTVILNIIIEKENSEEETKSIEVDPKETVQPEEVKDENEEVGNKEEESKTSEVDLKETVQPEEVKDENKEAGNKEEESKTSEVDSKEIVQPKEAS
ncbi:MAG: leucine-rich repeat protein [Tepidibacter sp.]|jgi:hypothetical protein|uniref:leucine-rich repeat protein n=1 Tax=Tepidibacter sp. TaxID=2529387 RepID=UPI0025DEE06B|nr:leucine-rich repeat protein [Tepidibacter sp.]MCT4507947.1 leucine-rich repeat protein [Tepidibacter sp.]